MELWKALAFLFPNASPLRDYRIQDDGAGPYIAAWHLPGPQPSAADLAVASAAYDAQQATQSATQARLKLAAKTAEGKLVESVKGAQLEALVAVLLEKAGALDSAGNVKPVDTWSK